MMGHGYDQHGYRDWVDYEAFEDDPPLESESDEGDDGDFNILDDIDTVLFFRVNSFVHSVTGHEIEHPSYLDEHYANQSDAVTKLASDERADYASSKINQYFHGLMELLRPEQVALVRKIHRALNGDISQVLEYFHGRTSQILSPSQVTQVHKASLDFVNNVRTEQMRARGLEQPGTTEIAPHSQKLMSIERDIIKEHVRHFLEKVESLISMSQWH